LAAGSLGFGFCFWFCFSAGGGLASRYGSTSSTWFVGGEGRSFWFIPSAAIFGLGMRGTQAKKNSSILCLLTIDSSLYVCVWNSASRFYSF
ncbi:hypothetical protein VIGAN_11211000, partial [Vigna angularis var. angularis]